MLMQAKREMRTLLAAAMDIQRDTTECLCFVGATTSTQGWLGRDHLWRETPLLHEDHLRDMISFNGDTSVSVVACRES
jgi:hypothetical protein